MPIVSSVVATGRPMNGADGFTLPRPRFARSLAKAVADQVRGAALNERQVQSLAPVGDFKGHHNPYSKLAKIDHLQTQLCPKVETGGNRANSVYRRIAIMKLTNNRWTGIKPLYHRLVQMVD